MSFYLLNTIVKRAALCCSLFSFFIVKAQQYQFVNLTTDDGLVQSQVTAMIQDKKGYLWFATYGGLSRYDGLTFENYGIEDGMMGNQVHALFMDGQQRIWMGYTGGVGYYQNKRFYPIKINQDVNQSNVSSLCQDKLGRTWVGFEDAGVGYITNENKLVLTDENGLVGTQVRSVHCDERGTLWVASANGLFKWNDSARKFDPSGIPGLDNISTSCVTSHKNTLYVSTFGSGVFICKNNQVKNLTAANGLVEDHIRNLYIDNRGELWAASIAGVSHYRNGLIINFNSKNGLPIENIRFVSEDNEGNIWMGTDGKGILKFAGESFVAFTKNDGLSSELIMSVIEDQSGNYWFGTYGQGVIKYSGTDYTQYTDANGLGNNIVWTSCETPDHKLWFGTSDGLCLFDGKKFSTVRDTSDYVSNKITSLLPMPDGSVWIGRRTGASFMMGQTIRHYDARHGLHGGNVRAMVTDSDGHVWFGGASGLFSFDGTRFTLFKPNAVLEDNTVYCLAALPKNRLWVGTNAGLYLFDSGNFTKLTLSDNPNSNNINFLLIDKNELWVGTNGGIFKVFPSGETNTQKLTVVAYTKYEGVRGAETNLNACYRDREGRLWFGTDAGLLRYDRSLDIAKEGVPPYMHINDVRIFFEKPVWKKYASKMNRESGLPVSPKLPHNRNHLTFYFTGISHSNPSRLRYVFKLDGFDDKWSPPTDADFATYTFLPDGVYTFRVKCINRDGVWSPESAFTFSIIPPFWRTWWFFITIAGIGLLLVVGIWRWRVAVLKRKNKTLQLYYHSKLLSLEQQSLNASMNRHFIFNSLNSIQYYINKQDRLEANRYLTNFAKLIRKNLDSSVNGENVVSMQEELERIKLYLSLEMMRFKDKFNYEMDISPEINLEALKIPPMLLQPYIENSIWHGILPKEEPGKIKLRIYYSPGSRDKICIEISDDGIGIETSLSRKVNTGSTHISRGIEITSGRLNLLKKMTSQDLEIHGPEQIYTSEGTVAGTRVLLIISTKALVKNELKNTNFSEKTFEF